MSLETIWAQDTCTLHSRWGVNRSCEQGQNPQASLTPLRPPRWAVTSVLTRRVGSLVLSVCPAPPCAGGFRKQWSHRFSIEQPPHLHLLGGALYTHVYDILQVKPVCTPRGVLLILKCLPLSPWSASAPTPRCHCEWVWNTPLPQDPSTGMGHRLSALYDIGNPVPTGWAPRG